MTLLQNTRASFPLKISPRYSAPLNFLPLLHYLHFPDFSLSRNSNPQPPPPTHHPPFSNYLPISTFLRFRKLKQYVHYPSSGNYTFSINSSLRPCYLLHFNYQAGSVGNGYCITAYGTHCRGILRKMPLKEYIIEQYKY